MPLVPDAGVPLNTFVAALNVTPLGRVPVSAMVGVGTPVAVTVNEPATSTVSVVLLALVIAGACVVCPKFAVTEVGAFMVTVVDAELALATGPVQLVKV